MYTSRLIFTNNSSIYTVPDWIQTNSTHMLLHLMTKNIKIHIYMNMPIDVYSYNTDNSYYRLSSSLMTKLKLIITESLDIIRNA